MYSKIGVSSQKKDVHEAIKNIDKGLYPKAFCKVIPDICGDSRFCSIMHADGAGTKSLIAYMYWKETGNINCFEGVSQDALIMNIDDVFCTGSPEIICLSTTIGRNAKRIPKEVLKIIIEGFEKHSKLFKKWSIPLHTTGGETADMGDVIRTIVVDATVFCRVPTHTIVDFSNTHTGDYIFGLSSYGYTQYEQKYNSGIGSNGLTLARHSLLNKSYITHLPEALDDSNIHTSNNNNNTHTPTTSPYYIGPYTLCDKLEGTPLTIGEALLSPTRTYSPILSDLLTHHSSMVHGIIHCTGGGQTKCLHFGESLCYVKDSLFPTPPIFTAIQREGNINWREMFEVFNMGHRMEIIGPQELQPILEKICSFWGVEMKLVGHIKKSSLTKGNELIIKTQNEEFYYTHTN